MYRDARGEHGDSQGACIVTDHADVTKRVIAVRLGNLETLVEELAAIIHAHDIVSPRAALLVDEFAFVEGKLSRLANMAALAYGVTPAG
jgi:hypothetical protein